MASITDSLPRGEKRKMNALDDEDRDPMADLSDHERHQDAPPSAEPAQADDHGRHPDARDSTDELVAVPAEE